MHKSLTALASVAIAAQLTAGGFWLQLGNPEASAQARSLKAVLTMKAAGCHRPENTQISGSAVGMVNGQRRTIPLKFAALSEPGMFALTQQWPAEGKWALEIVATNDGAVTSVVASAGPNGVDRKGAKFAAGRPSAEEVNAALR